MKAAGQPIASIAFDPGLIPETGLVRTAPGFVQWLSRTQLMKWFLKKIGVTMGSLSFSGAALAALATDTAFAHASGKYLQSNNGRLSEVRSSKVSYDQTKAAKLRNGLVDCNDHPRAHHRGRGSTPGHRR